MNYYKLGSTHALQRLGLGKLANVAKLPTALMRNTAMKAAPAGKTPMPPSFGGAPNKGNTGLFDLVDQVQKKKKPAFNPKQTLRGEDVPAEMPPISIIPAGG